MPDLRLWQEVVGANNLKRQLLIGEDGLPLTSVVVSEDGDRPLLRITVAERLGWIEVRLVGDLSRFSSAQWCAERIAVMMDLNLEKSP